MNPEIKDRLEKIRNGIVPEGYKKTEVGIFPEDWGKDELVNLSEDGINNGIFNDPQKVGNGCKLINVIDLYNEPEICIDNLTLLQINKKELNSYEVRKGDIFFTRSSLNLDGIAYCNIFLKEEKNIVYDCHIMRIRPKKNTISPFLLRLYCILPASRKYFMQHAKQTTMTTINQKDISKFPVSFPPLPEQSHIATILTTWDKAIELKEKLIEQKKLQKKGLMQMLLTGKIRVIYTETGKPFVGKINRKRIGEFLHEVSLRNKDQNIENILSVTNDRGFIKQSEQFERIVASKNTENYKIIKRNQFAYNPARINVGSIDILTNFDSGILSPMYVVFEIRDRFLCAEYFFQFIKSELFNNLLIKFLEGSVRDSLSFSALCMIKLFIPSLSEQKTIASILSEADKEIDHLEKELEQLKEQKRGLMQLLLTGIVRIT